MASRSSARIIRVSVGEWVRVPVPGDPWPVRMQIGDAPEEYAFIDHVRSGNQIRTVASRRCPDLRPGTYNVKVSTPDRTIEARLVVS